MELLVIPSIHDLQFESSQLQIDYQKINDEQGVIHNWRRKDRQILVSKMLKLIDAVFKNNLKLTSRIKIIS